jgi:hypothetical protein
MVDYRLSYILLVMGGDLNFPPSPESLKVTLYDENTDFIFFYIFIDLYSGAGDLSIAASFFQKY